MLSELYLSQEQARHRISGLGASFSKQKTKKYLKEGQQPLLINPFYNSLSGTENCCLGALQPGWKQTMHLICKLFMLF